jgi:hypothetical protein
MMNQALLQVTHELIRKDFEIHAAFSEEQIKAALAEVLVQLLLHDLEKLWNILYRIDVDENRVKALFNASDAKLIAPQLAHLIYKRVEQKALTRLQFK